MTPPQCQLVLTRMEPSKIEITFSDGRVETLSGLIRWDLHHSISYDFSRMPHEFDIRAVGLNYTGLQPDKEEMIYIIGEAGTANDTLAIKVGFSNNPEQRLKELQIGNPRTLYLLAAIPGTQAQERSLHRFLNDFSTSSNEWFAMTPEVRNMVSYAMSEGCTNAASIISGIVSGRFRRN